MKVSMKVRSTRSLLVLLCPLILFLSIPTVAFGQIDRAGLFEGKDPIDLTISGDLRSLFRDRSDDPSYFPINLQYEDDHLGEIDINLKARTRGHFRLQIANCLYPPLLLNFQKKKTPKESVFGDQDKIKLVVPCVGEEYVLKEYLLYKIYNLLTDYSFRVRLVQLTFHDTTRDKIDDPVMGFLLEDEDQMAERNDAKILKRNGLKGKYLDRYHFLLMAVFEYFIGNTDWSVEYRHNVKLVVSEKHSLPIPVPYDFDHAGAVAAPYAKPSEALQLGSVQKRRYRGFCLEDLQELDEVFKVFEEKRNEILTHVNGSGLAEKSKNKLTAFLDSFYDTIHDKKRRERDFTYPCLRSGTGNVVIRGLREESN